LCNKAHNVDCFAHKSEKNLNLIEIITMVLHFLSLYSLLLLVLCKPHIYCEAMNADESFLGGKIQDEMLVPALTESTQGLRGESNHDIDFKNDIKSTKESNLQNDEVGQFLEAREVAIEDSFEALAIPSPVQNMINLINNERQKTGASPLCLNNKLLRAAQSHTNDMVTNDFFSHTGSDGSKLSTRADRVNYKWRNLAENIAINRSVTDAHAGLMKSAGHKRNILDPNLAQIGLAIATQTRGKWKGLQYYTQVFGRSSIESCDNENVGSKSLCSDSPSGWYEDGNPRYNCDWYASGTHYCRIYGDDYRNFGKTANEACCVCGGGSA
jgi:hypothetical protein